ncbi:MAG: hypothetical protein JOZ48_11125 [Acidobacteriaceae bacterium]|nr:hypothetical protein [Acidobacteriaceae bacterium]
MVSFINVRKLAALDIVFHGPKLILIEFAIGTLLALAIGILSLARGHSTLLFLFALYMLSLGINYLPLLLHAISIVRSGDAAAEVSHELSNGRQSARKYQAQSLLLLIPVAVLALALSQLRDRRVTRS